MRRDACLAGGLLAVAAVGFVAIAATGTAPRDALQAWWDATRAGVTDGAVVFVMAAGVTLALGVAPMVRIAHGAIFAVGAVIGLVAVVLASEGAAVLQTQGARALAASLAAGLMAAGALGHAAERLVRPRARARRVAMAIAVLAALGVALHALVLAGPGDAAAHGLAGTIAIALGAAIALGCRGLAGSHLGLTVRAGVEDGALLALTGTGVARLAALCLGMATVLVVLGGGLWAATATDTTLSGGAVHVAFVLAALAIGGAGSLRGCLLAALGIGMVHGYAAALVPGDAHVATLGVCAALLALRPGGLMPVPRHARSHARP